MNRQNESSAEATTENIENKLDPNTPEILESKRGKNSKEHVSDPSRLDIEGYIFKDSKLIKKKKKVYTDVYLTTIFIRITAFRAVSIRRCATSVIIPTE